MTIKFTDFTKEEKEQKKVPVDEVVHETPTGGNIHFTSFTEEEEEEPKPTIGERLQQFGQRVVAADQALGQQIAPAVQTVEAVVDPLAVGETAAHLFTGTYGQIAQGLAGLREVLSLGAPTHGAATGRDLRAKREVLGKDVPRIAPIDTRLNKALTAMESAGNALIYSPVTAKGQHLTEAATQPFVYLRQFGDTLGDIALEKTGDPNIAAGVSIIPDMLLMGIGSKAAIKNTALTAGEKIKARRDFKQFEKAVKDTIAEVKKKGIDVEKEIGLTVDDITKFEPEDIKEILAGEQKRQEAPLTQKIVDRGEDISKPIESVKPEVVKPIEKKKALAQPKTAEDFAASIKRGEEVDVVNGIKFLTPGQQRQYREISKFMLEQNEASKRFTSIKAHKLDDVIKKYPVVKKLIDEAAPGLNVHYLTEIDMNSLESHMLKKRPTAKKSMLEFADQIEAFGEAKDKLYGELYKEIDPVKAIDEAVKAKKLDPVVGEFAKDISSFLKRKPDIQILDGASDFYVNTKKQIRIKNRKSVAHEYGHWAFYNILTAKERAQYIRALADYTSKTDINKYTTVYNKLKLKDKEGVEHTITSNVNDNFNEYYAEQFSQYVMYNILPAPKFRKLIEKAKDMLQSLYKKGRVKKQYDPNVLPYIEKVLSSDAYDIARKGMPERPVSKPMSTDALADMLFKKDEKLMDVDPEQFNYDPDIPYEALLKTEEIEGLPFGGDELAIAINALVRERFKKNKLDIDVARNALEAPPKTVKGYSEKEVSHYNDVIHDAFRKGVSFEDIYRRKGVDKAEASLLSKGAEKYAEAIKKEVEAVRGKQLNKVWKDKEKGILNTPVYDNDVTNMARVSPKDYRATVSEFFLTPDSFFDKLGPEVKDILHSPIRDAEARLFREAEQVGKKMDIIRRLVKRKDRKVLDNYTFAAQHNGPAYLKAIGEEVPKYSALSPEAKVAYEYMRNEYENLYNRLNMMRRFNGLKPFPKTENYFTFMSDLAALKDAGIDSLFMESDKFNNARKQLNATPFRYHKRRRQIELDNGQIIRMEHDAFKRFEIYQRSALRHIHMTPAVRASRGIIGQKKQFDREVIAGESANPKIIKKIEAGKLDPNKKVNDPYSFRFAKRAPEAANYINSWLDIVALGRETGIEALGKVPKRLSDTGNALLRGMNEGLTQSLLAGSVRLSFLQPTALIGTAAVTSRYMPIAFMKSFSPKQRAIAMEKSRVLRGRVFDANVDRLADAIFASGTIGGKVRAGKRSLAKHMLTFTRLVDGEIARLSWHAFHDKAKGMGYAPIQAVRYADSMVVKTQSSGLLSDRAPIQRNILGKTLTMFQTYTISQYNLLRNEIVGRGGKAKGAEIYVPEPRLREALKQEQQMLRKIATEAGINPKRITKKQAVLMAAKFAAATALFNALFEEIIGIDSPNPTPIKTAQNKIRDGESVDRALIAAMNETAGYLPLLGSINYGRGPAGATYEAVTQLLTARTAAGKAKAAARLYGVPGMSQAEVVARALKDDPDNPVFYILKQKQE